MSLCKQNHLFQLFLLRTSSSNAESKEEGRDAVSGKEKKKGARRRRQGLERGKWEAKELPLK